MIFIFIQYEHENYFHSYFFGDNYKINLKLVNLLFSTKCLYRKSFFFFVIQRITLESLAFSAIF